MNILSLGIVEFQGFEIPAHVEFGGDQKLSVHKLIGGTRVVDALGRDDNAVSWSGVLSGNDAADRARLLDGMRASGELQGLSWNAFCYSVLIAELRLQFCSPWWIPYHIKCTVLRDLAQTVVAYIPSTQEDIQADLGSLQSFLDAGTAAAVHVAAASATSTGGSTMALQQLSFVRTTIANAMAGAEAKLESQDITQVVAASGTLANFSCALGFLDRSTSNLILTGSQ